MKTHSIARSLGKLSKKWLCEDYPYRRLAVERLVSDSGYTEKMAHAMVDALFRELTTPKLMKLLRSELRDPRVLDRFRKDTVTGAFHRAYGPQRILYIFAANVPNPAVVSFVIGMLLKSVNIGKLSSEDPGILDIYLASLRKHDARLAEMNILIDPKDRKALRQWAASVDRVVAYGSDETLRTIRREIPDRVPFTGYGHRISIGVFAKEALTGSKLGALAKKCANDIWMLGQRGCLSPQIFYLEKPGAVKAFRQGVERELARLGEHWQSRQMRALGGAPIAIETFSGIGPLEKKLKRFAKVLQAAALEAGPRRRADFAGRLAALGVNRVCRTGKMQEVPLTWHHDGGLNFAGWLRWTDLEP